MGGSLVLIDGQRARAVAGLALASAFAAVYTHAGPYVSRPLNALSFAATHLVVIVYAGGVMVVCRPSAFDDTALGTALLLGSLALIAWAVALQFEKNQRTGRMLRALQRGGGDGAGGDAVRRASAMLGMDARSAMTRAKSDLESSLDRAERQHAGHEESFYGGELLDRQHFQEIWSESTDAQHALVDLVFDWFSNNLVLPVRRPPAHVARLARARALSHSRRRARRTRSRRCRAAPRSTCIFCSASSRWTTRLTATSSAASPSGSRTARRRTAAYC